jgi:16S rRNA (guanine966-N2)-methyltransferase
MSGLRVLDLYAGTGALGIEALSRGASHATFVESDRHAVACVRENLTSLGLEGRSEVLPLRVTAARKSLTKQEPFDLVLCDPPWSEAESAALELARLVDQGGLAAEGRVVLEHSARSARLEPAGLFAYDQRVWGDTATTLLMRTLANTGGAPL